MGRVMPRIREEVAAGRQAYIVCARIGSDRWQRTGTAPDPDEDDAEARKPAVAVLDLAPELAAGRSTGCGWRSSTVSCPPETKDDVMRRFAEGAIDVLVATTVVEVGVDVPNATVMVVMDADRFGVSQLHQLRGRVGRGSERSFCLLVTDVQAARPGCASTPSPERSTASRCPRSICASDGRATCSARPSPDVASRCGCCRCSTRRRHRRRSIGRIALVDEDPELVGHPALLATSTRLTADERADYLERS